jgi:Uma2 family endonuclease
MKNIITDLSELDLNKQYTYADYLTWRFSERVELIKGWIHKMTPAPLRKHQRVSGNVFGEIWSYIKKNKKECQVFDAPFDVRLVKNKGKNGEINTVVQPDICVICDKTKLDRRGCVGAPDLIVEILSASTSKKDYNEKYNLYEENGVKEYWIVSPSEESVEVFLLKDGKYYSEGVYTELDGFEEVQVGIFPDLKLKLSEIFEE